MQRKLVVSGIVLIVGALLIGTLFIIHAPANASRTVSVNPTPPSPRPPPPSTFVPPAQLLKQAPPAHVGGVPAIHHSGAGPVTAADIQAFTAVHGFLGAARGRNDAGAIPAIVQLKLMAASQASSALKGEYVDRPSTAQVWFVELQGPFTFYASEPDATGSFTVKNAIELFDATTGDLILLGTNG